MINKLPASPEPLSKFQAGATWPGGVGDPYMKFNATGGKRKTRRSKSRKSRKVRKTRR
jgi:hypothetical protein